MNSTYSLRTDKHFLRCWARQSCGACLDQARCSWCPFTQSCVPNNYTIPALAPAYNEDICPHWAERWEIRTRPLGCQVSTITSLTSIVSIVATLLVVLLVFWVTRGIKRLNRFRRENPEWWRERKASWRGRLPRWVVRSREEGRDAREEEPLLGP